MERKVYEFENKRIKKMNYLLDTSCIQEGEKPALTVFLHGAGERGEDFEKLYVHGPAKYVRRGDLNPKAVLLCPQCPDGFVWNLLTFELKELIDSVVSEYGIDEDRISITGISMGGFGTWDIMMRHNDVFAAGIPVCGGGDPSQAENLVDVPLFVFHGDKDDAVPVSGSRDTVQAIKDAGGTKVEYVEYAGAGHGIWNNAFATEGLLEKLLQQRLSDRIPVEESSEEPSEDVSDTSASSDSGNGGFLNYAHFVPIIAAVVISVGLVIYTIIKYKK